MTFEQFFDTTFDDKMLNLSKGDLKTYIKNLSEVAYYEGDAASTRRATEHLARNRKFNLGL
jgi:hypothetical protein